MNLYLVSQDRNRDYDTYDSMVVAAETEEAARLIHPSVYASDEWWNNKGFVSDWAMPDRVQVDLIGTATPETQPGVICASFNAG